MSQTNTEGSESNIRVYSELGDPKPGLLSWVTALLLVGILVFGLRFGQSACVGLRYARLQDSFNMAILGTSDFERLIDSIRFRPLFSAREKLIKSVRPLFGMIRRGELSRALEMLSMPEAPKNPVLYVMTARLRTMAEEDKRYQRLKQDEKFASGTEPNLWARYLDIRQRTVTLLAIRTSLPNEQKFEFYESGFFAGGPKVPGVPDGVESIEHLAAFSPALKDLPPSELWKIDGKLKEISTSGEQLSEQVSNHKARSAVRETEMKEVSEKRKRALRESRILLRKFTADLSHQPLSLEVRRNYAYLRGVLANHGVETPELLIEERSDMISEDEISSLLDAESQRSSK